MEGRSIFCPTLIVAAPNRDLNAMAKEKLFREDLLARFTDHHVIPPLRDRIEDLNSILDCLLQSEAVNPEKQVIEIGTESVAAIINWVRQADFKGNFRELDTIMRAACQAASKEGRGFICAADLGQVLPRRSGGE
jgi:transcriptional regulator with GAF, ATPase, and Fis domain